MTSLHDETLANFDPRKPWMQAVMFGLCVPLFPEYIAPLLAVAALLFARLDLKRHRREFRVGAAGKVILAYIVYMTVHLAFSDSPGISAATVAWWIAMFLLYLALSNVLTNPRRIETTLFTLSVIAGLIGVLSCFQYAANALLGWDIPLQLWDFVDESVYALFPFDVSLNTLGIRAAATFSNPNIFAAYAVMATPFVAAYAFTGERSSAKILSRLSLLALVLGLLFSFSRGCYLAIGAIAIVMCIANIRRLVPILIVGASVFLLIPDAVFQRLLSVNSSSDVAITERFDVWGVTMQTILERPLLGHGAGIGAVWSNLSAAGIAAPHAHNLMLEWLAEGGIVALGLLFLLVWRLFRTGFELIIHTQRTRMFGAAVVAFCIGLCVCGMFDYPLFTPKQIGMLMTVMALTDSFGHLHMKQPRWSVVQALPFYSFVISLPARWRQRGRRTA